MGDYALIRNNQILNVATVPGWDDKTLARLAAEYDEVTLLADVLVADVTKGLPWKGWKRPAVGQGFVFPVPPQIANASVSRALVSGPVTVNVANGLLKACPGIQDPVIRWSPQPSHVALAMGVDGNGIVDGSFTVTPLSKGTDVLTITLEDHSLLGRWAQATLTLTVT